MIRLRSLVISCLRCILKRVPPLRFIGEGDLTEVPQQ